MVYRDAQYINKLLLFYINICLIIAETYDVMADAIFLKTEDFSFVFGFGLYSYRTNLYVQEKKMCKLYFKLIG
jgi:hypothetical protein